MKPNLKRILKTEKFWMILNKTRGTIYCEQFPLKIRHASCFNGLKYSKCVRKKNKAKHVIQ